MISAHRRSSHRAQRKQATTPMLCTIVLHFLASFPKHAPPPSCLRSGRFIANASLSFPAAARRRPFQRAMTAAIYFSFAHTAAKVLSRCLPFAAPMLFSLMPQYAPRSQHAVESYHDSRISARHHYQLAIFIPASCLHDSDAREMLLSFNAIYDAASYFTRDASMLGLPLTFSNYHPIFTTPQHAAPPSSFAHTGQKKLASPVAAVLSQAIFARRIAGQAHFTSVGFFAFGRFRHINIARPLSSSHFRVAAAIVNTGPMRCCVATISLGLLHFLMDKLFGPMVSAASSMISSSILLSSSIQRRAPYYFMLRPRSA